MLKNTSFLLPQRLTTFFQNGGGWALFAVLLTCMVYIPNFSADFVNWDDWEYVYENPTIRSFDNWRDLLWKPMQGNHHPITMFSLALNYAISGNDAWSYHLFNILIHLCNTVWVFVFIQKLTRMYVPSSADEKPTQNTLIPAFVTSVLFGIHPAHVESVAWVTERKDVLYAFFFLAGLYSYLGFLQQKKLHSYGITLILFVLSLLSKPAAVIFPICLFTVDFLLWKMPENATKKVWLSLLVRNVVEKVPFLLLAFAMGYLSYKAQDTMGATSTMDMYALWQRLLFGCYGWTKYLIHLFYPFHLVTFYPMPPIEDTLPTVYYFMPIGVIVGVLAALIAYVKWKNKLLLFGLGFYTVNLLLVLQVVSVGSAVMADRYTYMPYIGVFYLLGMGANALWQHGKWASWSVLTVGTFIIAGVSVLGYFQVAVWNNSATLWDHTIAHLPSGRAYGNRAVHSQNTEQFEEALAFYKKALVFEPDDWETHCNMGNIYVAQEKYDSAIIRYNRAVELNSEAAMPYDNRGSALTNANRYEEAIEDYQLAIQKDSSYLSSYQNMGITYMNMEKYDAAIPYFQHFLTHSPSNPDIWNSQGHCQYMLGQYPDALASFYCALEYKSDTTYWQNVWLARAGVFGE